MVTSPDLLRDGEEARFLRDDLRCHSVRSDDLWTAGGSQRLYPYLMISCIIFDVPARRPPSTGSTAPVIQDASSDARKRAALTTSSGSPTRPSGYHAATRSKTRGSFC